MVFSSYINCYSDSQDMIEFDFSINISPISSIQFLLFFFLFFFFFNFKWILTRVVRVYSIDANEKRHFSGYSLVRLSYEGFYIFLPKRILERGYTNMYCLCIEENFYESQMDMYIFVIIGSHRYSTEIRPVMDVAFQSVK